MSGPTAGTLAQALPFALRALRRDWRAGELRVLLVALVVAVASVTSVGFFTDRLHQAMNQQASELLAADLVVLSANPIQEALAREAAARGLGLARAVTFPSMVLAGDRLQLADVKAVDGGYPLRGRLRVAPAPYAPDAIAERGPAPGTAWLDPRLFGVLGVSVGDRVTVGASELEVANVLSYEPDRGGDLFSIAPRLLMNLADIPATRLIQPGSRVKYRLLVAGQPKDVAAYRAWLDPRIEGGETLQGVRDARPEMRMALDRAQRFLGLAALVSVVLAGVAVAVAARRYARRHQDPSAVMRCLGATQGFVTRLFVIQMLALGLLASLAGSLLGYGAQEGLVAALASLLPGALPAPSPLPLLSGLLTGLVTLLGFGLPPIMRLRDVPPSRVLRQDPAPLPPRGWVVYGSALAALALLVSWQAADGRLAAYALGGTLATVLILAGGALVMVRALGPLRARVGAAWRFGLASIARHASGSMIQVVAFGLGIMVLLLLTLVRGELLQNWQQRLPADAPNYFLINVQPDEVEVMKTFLTGRGLAGNPLYPMVRGRLTAVDGRTVSADDYENPRAQRLVEREFNLSWAARPQADNEIVAGRWWSAQEAGKPMLSVERGLAETLGIGLGDELSFQVAGRRVTARVTSLRTVEWDSFRPNFFVVAPPGLLNAYPATYITSFYLPPERQGLLAELVRSFPSVTVLDVDAIMRKVRGIMDQAALAVQYVFLFTLLAGLTVLLAAIQSTLDERRRESAIVRTLGGSRVQLLKGLIAEFTTLGALSGLLAALAATAVGLVLAEQVFQLAYRPSPWTWVIGALGGTLGVGLAGVLGTSRVLSHPPVESLRQG